MKKPIEFDSSLQCHSRMRYYFIILPDEVVVKRLVYLTDWLRVNKDLHVTLSPVKDPERSRREPDWKAMIDDLIYLREHCSNHWRPKIQSVIDSLSRVYSHTPQGDQPTEVKEQDYEAMWKDFREAWGMNEPLDEDVQAMTCELKRQMDKIEAKHTPPFDKLRVVSKAEPQGKPPGVKEPDYKYSLPFGGIDSTNPTPYRHLMIPVPDEMPLDSRLEVKVWYPPGVKKEGK